MTEQKEWKCLFLIIVIFLSACIETDIYLPAFPDMMKAFNTTEGAIQGLLTWNFIGICISGPLYGPISDAFGRKKPLMLALGLFLFGSAITCIATNLDQMLWGRIFQGMGSGGCFTLGTAIVFDVFQKEKGVKALNTMNTVVPLIIAGAPVLGAYCNHAFGFRSNFLIIAFFVLISFLICLFFFDETLGKEKRTTLRIRSILRDFKQAFTCLAFWQLTLTTSLMFAAYISFLSGSAVLFVIEFGVSKALYPVFQAAILGGWLFGSLFLNRSWVKWGIPRIKKAGILLIALGALELATAAIVMPQNPWLLTTGMVIYAFGANWIVGLYFPEAMELLPHIKGITASLLTSVRLLIAALIVGLMSSLYNGTIYPLAVLVVGTIIVIVPTIRMYERRRVDSGISPTQESVHYH